MEFTGITDEEQLNLALLLGRTASYISTHGNYDLVAQREEKSLEVKTRFLKKKTIVYLTLCLSSRRRIAIRGI